MLEDEKHLRVEEGILQADSASPLLANLYLHYVFDLWVQAWCRKRALGYVIVVLGFQVKSDAERFRAELEERFRKYSLEVHPQKARMLELGLFAIHNLQRRGDGKPETFHFLGFTHTYVRKRSNGIFTVLRQTMRKRLQPKLKKVKAELLRCLIDRWLPAARIVHPNPLCRMGVVT